MVKSIIDIERQFYTGEELRQAGLSYYKINKLVQEGLLLKVNNKVYENTNYEGDESDFSYVKAYIPKGVVCLMSAARYYDLTTYLPDRVDVAIERNMKVTTLPSRPNINLVYFSEKRYQQGVDMVNEGGEDIQIYDIEKTVIDIIFYRNKVGIEETREILNNYLRRSDRNLNRLHRYATELRCEKILRTYLEVLIS